MISYLSLNVYVEIVLKGIFFKWYTYIYFGDDTIMETFPNSRFQKCFVHNALSLCWLQLLSHSNVTFTSKGQVLFIFSTISAR